MINNFNLLPDNENNSYDQIKRFTSASSAAMKKLPLNQEDIGNLVDSSRESISRVFSEFESDNNIKISGKKIEIINRHS